ncbi:nucleotidyltransferase domain-containing protein [Metallibacterium sp.]|uniref:type VII toxin-antitoxin system MntA family adenylyltransferase antitoxin n=1 Tax=Metallibacterium sp. TaxID=2940281 RepID=UPI0026119322|nr:nucleotidyltransferase domain-containing protein [Metallibacterium sp.]
MKPDPVLLPEFIDPLRAVLARHPQVNFAMLFGSLARGTARPDSDLDLAVGADRPLHADEIIALISDLAMATGRPVDLIDLAAAGEPLLGQILAHGVRVLGDNTRHGALLSRHLTDVADFVPLQQRIFDERRRRWIGR